MLYLVIQQFAGSKREFAGAIKSTSVRNLSLRLLNLKSIRFGARCTESIYGSGLFPQVLFLPLSLLLSIVSSLFSCSLLFLPFSLIPPLSSLLSLYFPFSLLFSLLSSLFSFFLFISSFFLLSPFSIFFLSFSLPLFLSSSLLLFFSSLSPSPLCSLLSSQSYF